MEEVKQKNSMYIEVEDENEINRLQQEIIKSNIPIEDVAKLVGKLQKLYELSKYNSSNPFANIGSLDTTTSDWYYSGGLYTTRTGVPIITNDMMMSNLDINPITAINKNDTSSSSQKAEPFVNIKTK